MDNSSNLFYKYKELTTWFGRTFIDKEIDLLLPSGYHKLDGDIGEATFYPGNKYGKMLYEPLFHLDTVAQWIKDFGEAKRVLLWQMGLTRRMPEIIRAIHFRVKTFKPTSAAVSGGVGRNVSQESWANIRSGGGNEIETGTVTHDIRSGDSDPSWRILRRVITMFDTSSLTSTASIDSATWGLYVNAVTDTFVQTIRMVDSTPASATALENADYAQVGTTAQSDTTLALSAMTTSAYNRLTLNSTGEGNISKTGITKFGARFLDDINNNEPTWESVADGNYTWDSESGTNAAELVVTFTKPGGGFIFNIL